MNFNDNLKKWAEGTPISKFFENKSVLHTTQYSRGRNSSKT